MCFDSPLIIKPRFALSPQDAIVFASLVSHLKSQTSEEGKIFVTKNKNDFVNPDIFDFLSSHNCKLIFKYMDAVGYIEDALRGVGEGEFLDRR